MNDTNPELELIFNEMLIKKTGQERLKMGFSMFDFARKQVLASIKIKNPNVSSQEIRREIFIRFYSEDFTQTEQEKILKQLG